MDAESPVRKEAGSLQDNLGGAPTTRCLKPFILAYLEVFYGPSTVSPAIDAPRRNAIYHALNIQQIAACCLPVRIFVVEFEKRVHSSVGKPSNTLGCHVVR